LIQLARRTRDRDSIEQMLSAETRGANPSIAASRLRADILSSQTRRADLEQFLLG